MKEQYVKAAVAVVPLVSRMDDDRLSHPTPCADFNVRGLLNHLFQVMVEFQKGARFEKMDFSYQPDFVTGDWRQRFATELDALTEAWSRPGALEEPPGAGVFPRAITARLPLLDLTIHGWDLSVATALPYVPDAELVDQMYAMALDIADNARQAGQFGPAQPVADHAPTLDKLLAVTGRYPGWKP